MPADFHFAISSREGFENAVKGGGESGGVEGTAFWLSEWVRVRAALSSVRMQFHVWLKSSIPFHSGERFIAFCAGLNCSALEEEEGHPCPCPYPRPSPSRTLI